MKNLITYYYFNFNGIWKSENFIIAVCDNGEIFIYYWINGSHWAAQMMVVQFKKKNNKYTNITNKRKGKINVVVANKFKTFLIKLRVKYISSGHILLLLLW